MKNKLELDKKALGQRLREQREKAGYTQKELAKVIDLSQQTISGYESGKVCIDLENAYRFAEIFGNCDAGYLLGFQSATTRDLSDASEITGLSEAAIANLKSLKQSSAFSYVNYIFEHLSYELVMMLDEYEKLFASPRGTDEAIAKAVLEYKIGAYFIELINKAQKEGI